MFVPPINALAIPEFTFDPNLLFKTLLPLLSKKLISRVQTVVFPFVPVTPITTLGLSIFSRKFG